MPTPPLPFDDDEAALPVDAQPPPPSRRGTPNFWVRRIVVVGGVVAVFATAALVVGQLVGTDSDATTSGAISAEWSRVVTVDQRTGRVVVNDESGDEIGRIDTGVRSSSASSVVADTAVLVGPDAAAIVGLDDEAVTDVDVTDASIVQPAGSALTMIIASPMADRGVIVHAPSGDVLDTDSSAPIPGTRFEWDAVRSDPSGRHLLVTDSGNFQSVLFSFDRDEPAYVPGLALAVDDERVVTTQNVGTEATISVFDHDGTPISSGTASSVRAAMITGDTIRLVTVDGEIVTMETASGDTESSGRLEIGQIESGRVSSSGDRLIVSGADGTAIVDDDGSIVATFADLQLGATSWAAQGSGCVALLDGDDVVTIVALDDGSVENEASVDEPLFASADGCTLATPLPDGYQLVSPESIATVTTTGELAGLSPDTEAVVLELDRRLVLSSVGADAAEGVDLGPVGRTVAFS
jgi:hypothetical protein